MATTHHLWSLMQRIEYCRHHADMAEAKSSNGSKAFRAEMAAVSRQWRDLAKAFEQLDQGGFFQALEQDQ
jgi:hypothetical protein